MSDNNNTPSLPKSSERQVYTVDHEGKDLQKVDTTAVAKVEGEDYLGQILKSLKDQQVAQRVAFEVDPSNVQGVSSYGALYVQKTKLTPDWVIKALTGPGGDELLNQILQARSNVIASFGRPKSDRFSVGFEFLPINKSTEIDKDADKAAAVKDLIEKAKEIFWNCGYAGLKEDQTTNLSQFLKMIVRDGLRFGRCAIEVIHAVDPTSESGEKVHSFRPVDSGTIYRIKPKSETDQSVRNSAIKLLQELKNEKIDVTKYKKDEYKWVQVVDGKPIQAFSDKELIVYNFYPTTNVEYSGYPLTPIDQAISAIMTHINITLHNKLYFQHGRATRGMLVFNSESMDEMSAQKIRLQFNQTINTVHNSWRMPVFVVGETEKVTWQPIDQGGRDMEFQYLMDNNSRIIMGAFQMSPDELPGYNHLSRGTNTQALSESSNEWKMTASRDTGLRPLIYDIQDLFNTHLFPRFLPNLSESHQMIFSGLDKEDPEKESTRLQQDMNVHLTYNDILKKVEKDILPAAFGADFPLNPQFQQVVEKYMTFGEIQENFFGKKGAAQDPRNQWYANPMWMQQQQMLVQNAQIAMQNQMQAQQMVAQAMNPQPQQDPNAPQQEGDGGEPTQKSEKDFYGEIFQKNMQNIQTNHNTISNMILARHSAITKKHSDDFQKQSKKAAEKLTAGLIKKKKK
jgi:hypothetical protein